MSMTRKHFTEIASILSGTFASATPECKGPIWGMTLSLADYFQSVNPNFDRSRFYTAVLGSSDHFAVRDEFQAEMEERKLQRDGQDSEGRTMRELHRDGI